jgi:predicted O-linked N-acetylglucosamine transferase (SPINDLY family)
MAADTMMAMAQVADGLDTSQLKKSNLALEELRKGTTCHRAGELGLAQSHYQRAVKLDPANADAWHLLGVAALQSGNLQLAVKRLRTCLQQRPQHAEAQNNLGVALRRLDRHAEALSAFRGAMAARENYVEAAYNLGLTLETVGDEAGAARTYEDALRWRGTYVEAAINLGNLRRRQGRHSDALALLELAQRLAPDRAQTNGNLALILIDVERFADAASSARAAIAIEPDTPQWWRALGVAQRLQRDLENAIASLRRAVELAPRDESAAFELGLALQDAGAVDEARSIYAKTRASGAMAERLRWTDALSLPSVYADETQVDLERRRFADCLGQISERLRLSTAQEIGAAYEAACGVAPFLLHYQPRDNTDLQCRFGDLVSRVMAAAAPDLVDPCSWSARAHGGRVRVGIVSSHLTQHSVARYFSELIVGLDPQRFDVRVWYGGVRRDASTEYIASRVGQFAEAGADAVDVARRIRAAELDVLVYPEIGMDPRHQAMAALRLAPVQCALYGHPATSGLPNIDFFISGAALEPPDAQRHYRERLVCLPGIGTRPQRSPAIGDGAWFDAVAAGAPLLLCLQNFIKLEPSFDATLARIAASSGARIGLIPRNPPLTERFRTRIERAFVALGVDPARHLRFLPVQTHADFLAGIARAPLVLDPPSFSGGATSLDAFSVGTPVLTRDGPMARGRQSAAMLRMMGIDDLIADSEEHYVTTAVAFVRDDARRELMRQRIEQRQSLLFDDDRAVTAFADFLATASDRSAA